MHYVEINMKTYPRKSHFEHFNSLANPYASVTVSLDITAFLQTIKKEGSPFFLRFLYEVAGAADSVPAFRQRIINGKIIEFPYCTTSHTVMKEDGTFAYCHLHPYQPLDSYLPEAIKKQKDAKENGNIHDDADILHAYFVSCIPWFSFTAITQSTPIPADSNPRFAWGKYEEEQGKIKLPFSVQFNHALMDGRHIGLFLDALHARL
ncbi:MAG TPA: chloramphenicol acetyltransferase [Clostridiales bacterium]|nr:chloramphenicol acetyltransferase [Clostridiales bacterium]